MEIARTSIIHARGPHFLWPYTVRYAGHQLNLWPRVSRPEVSSIWLSNGSLGVTSCPVRCDSHYPSPLISTSGVVSFSTVILTVAAVAFGNTATGVQLARTLGPLAVPQSLTTSSHPITNYYRTAHLVVSRVLPSLVTDITASPSSVSALVATYYDFAATRRLDYATRMVASPPLSTRSESAIGCDILEDRQFELEFLAAVSPHLCAVLLAPEGDPHAFDMPTPRTYPQRDYELHTPNLSTTFLHGHIHEEIWLCHPPGFTGTFPPWTQWSPRRPVYVLRQVPCEWHDTLCSTLAYLGFSPSSFICSCSTPFFALVYITRDRFSCTGYHTDSVTHGVVGPST
ncbi:unnamed protein product, partial [Closterium sp. NIES-53]